MAREYPLRKALHASKLAAARVAGMKIRAAVDRPTAAVGTFPYPHRTCAEWMDVEPTDEERSAAASDGSRRLKEAIERIAA